MQWGGEWGRLRPETQQLPPKYKWQVGGKVTSSPSLCPLPELSIDYDVKDSSKGLFGNSNEGATSLMNLSLGLSQDGQWRTMAGVS